MTLTKAKIIRSIEDKDFPKLIAGGVKFYDIHNLAAWSMCYVFFQKLLKSLSYSQNC
jgi:hypothetical protein